MGDNHIQMRQLRIIPILILCSCTNLIAQLTPTYNDILIPMRDGQFLSADVFIPSNVTESEVILVQTPYNKNLFSVGLPLGIGQNLADQPYIWVIVDWRGFYGSAAAATASPDRGEDAYDVCEWIVDQTWHRDRIGTWGPSALGKIQYDLAFEQHPNHTCAVPIVAHPQFCYDDFFYGGVLEEARLEQLDNLGYGLSPVIMSNVYYSPTWTIAENTTWTPDLISIPTLQIGGWYDHNIDKMTDWYKATRSLSTAPDEQWLLVGPWVHGGTGIANVGSSVQGELSYPNAALVNNEMAWDFFNYYLLDSVNNWQNTPKITYYELGSNTWNNSNATSIEQTVYNTIFLESNGNLISGNGSGQSSLTSDPYNPAPTIGGATLHIDLDQGPYDQISLSVRSDILTFETTSLPSDVQISGRVKCTFYVSADQADCDIIVHLVDAYPDGRDMLITDGARRMRFRNGYTSGLEAMMVPGTVYPVEIELPFTNYTWKSGHKIKIYVGSNSSIRWNVNLQNGGPMYTAGTPNIASITIHHNATSPSRIELPGNNPLLAVQHQKIEDFDIYPNPVDDILLINIPIAPDEITLLDIEGKIPPTLWFDERSISTAHLQTGVYLLRIRTGESVITKKVIKK